MTSPSEHAELSASHAAVRGACGFLRSAVLQWATGADMTVALASARRAIGRARAASEALRSRLPTHARVARRGRRAIDQVDRALAAVEALSALRRSEEDADYARMDAERAIGVAERAAAPEVSVRAVDV